MNDVMKFFEIIFTIIVNFGKIVMAYLDDMGIIVVFILVPILIGIIISFFSGIHRKKEKITK